MSHVVVDAVIGGLILLSGVAGLRRGFARESLSLAVWGLIFFAALFINDFAALATRYASEDLSRMPSVLIFFLFLACMLIGGAVAGMLLQRLIRALGLHDADRVAGGLFGILRGAVVLALFAIYVPPLVALDQAEAWQQSRLVGMLLGMEDALSQVGMRLHDALRDLRPADVVPADWTPVG